MKEEEWRIFHNFSLEDMEKIKIALSISKGKITEIFNEKLDYQDIKISMKSI